MTILMHEQMIEQMLAHQDELNSLINPQWRDAQYPWHTAIWTECAELMDHIGWKWWTKQERNEKQTKLEIADIWHFILSWNLQEGVNATFDPAFETSTSSSLSSMIADLVQAAACADVIDSEGSFVEICIELGITLDDLYKLHTAKYVLNKFRQMNGYKSGTYIKVWADGREDNEHLYDYVEHLPITDDFVDKVLIGLNRLYATNAVPLEVPTSEYLAL